MRRCADAAAIREILKGRAAIRERYARGFDGDRERGHTRSITFELVDRVVSGDVRSDYGYYTIIGRSSDGHEKPLPGKLPRCGSAARRGGGFAVTATVRRTVHNSRGFSPPNTSFLSTRGA